jgi:hypothetical protein
MNLPVQRYVQTDGEALLQAIGVYIGHITAGEQDEADAFIKECQAKNHLLNVNYTMPNTEARQYAMELYKLEGHMGYTKAFASKWIKDNIIGIYGGVSVELYVKDDTFNDCMSQILCEITEHLVNIMLSIFTPTESFTMENDEMFEKYKEQNVKGTRLEPGISNNAEGCWKWMTSTESQEKLDRAKPLINIFTRDIADRIDELFTTSIGTKTNYLMVWRSTAWQDIYADYLNKLEEFIREKYTTDLCEDKERRAVHQQVWRKIEWVMMKHEGRRERPYPLLTKSLLPQLANVLSHVRNAIAEVCDIVLSLSSIPADRGGMMRGG